MIDPTETACRVRGGVQAAMLQDAPQEAVPLLLQQVLRKVPLRASGNLRQQGNLPLLQQLEDQERRAQVPLMTMTSLFFFFVVWPGHSPVGIIFLFSA